MIGQNIMPIQAYNMGVLQHALTECLKGEELEERGQKYRSWDAAHVTFDSNLPILFNFVARKLNVRYAIEEFLWYCRADRYDSSITEHATAWKKLNQPDGSFFSNYGHYIFAKMTPDGVSAFEFALEQLMRNPSSRRAAIPLLQTDHCFNDNVDMVCTFALQFFVRQGRLDMIVNMRSNDAIWGLTNDAFCFSMIHRMMYVMLCGTYTGLRLGTYHHIANTLHVYERHYDMAKAIVAEDVRRMRTIDAPMFTSGEVRALLDRRTGLEDHERWISKIVDSSLS